MSNSPVSSPAPPPARRVVSRPVVKILLPLPGTDAPALLFSEDRKVATTAPVGAVSKRFAAGEREGYFKCEFDADGILEIGERLPDPEPRW